MNRSARITKEICEFCNISSIRQLTYPDAIKYFEEHFPDDEKYNDIDQSLSGNVLFKTLYERVAAFLPYRTTEHNHKISMACKGRIAWNKGIPWNDDAKAKMSNAHIGKKHTPEHCAAITRGLLKKYNTQE